MTTCCSVLNKHPSFLLYIQPEGAARILAAPSGHIRAKSSPRPSQTGAAGISGCYLLLCGYQICCCSAARISSSRKSGCAMEISFSARSHTLRPFRHTQPYSVTTFIVFTRVSVTTEPGASVGRMRECTPPFLSLNVEERQIKLLPPLDRYAPRTKSCWPPAPLICLVPAVSPLTCP